MIRIYKITNNFLTPPKCYIGQTNRNLEERFKEHLRIGQKGVNRELAIDLMNYGKINFKIELLEMVEENQSKNKESEYIKLYNTHYKDGYGYNMRYEDIIVEQKIKNWNKEDLIIKKQNINEGNVWNKGLKTRKYISEKISNTIKNKYDGGWISPSWGHNHSEETKKRLSIDKKKYYESNRPHNAVEWVVEYENGKIEKTNRLLDYLGGKKQYNRITKWCREHPFKFHPKLKMKVYHAN